LVAAHSKWWNKQAGAGTAAIEAEKVAVHASRRVSKAHE